MECATCGNRSSSKAATTRAMLTRAFLSCEGQLLLHLLPVAATVSYRFHRYDKTSFFLCSRAMSRTTLSDKSFVYLEGPNLYCCNECGTHLSTHDDIVSKSFNGRHGRAFLLQHCVNVTIGPAEERQLLTGLHVVCDIFCKRCETLIGWTYKRAHASSQKYKEGKFIVEKVFMGLST